MKVVSVMTTSSRGGAEYAAMELLHALGRRGHETVMLTNHPGIARDTDVRVLPLQIGEKLSRRTYRDLAVHWFPNLRRLRAALDAEAPFDVLLLHYKKEQLMAPWLPTRLRPRIVWSEWGPVPYPMRLGPPRWLYLAAARRTHTIMAVSEGTKQSLCEVGLPAARVHVVPNALRTDAIRFSPQGRTRIRRELGIPADAFVVGCTSRFHPKKRNEVVIDALACLEGTPHLVLAGEGETEGELRSRARRLGERAHFVPTPGDDVADYFSAFDVSVFCPSPTEGAPIAVALAMLTGRPVLATGAEGVLGMIGPGTGAIASPEHDADALAALLRAYAHDPERIRREGALARRLAETRYDALRIASHVEELLESTDGRVRGGRRIAER